MSMSESNSRARAVKFLSIKWTTEHTNASRTYKERGGNEGVDERREVRRGRGEAVGKRGLCVDELLIRRVTGTWVKGNIIGCVNRVY